MKHASLNLLIEQARRNRDDAARLQAQAERELVQAERVMQMLKEHRHQQSANLRATIGGDTVVRADSLARQSQFGVKLGEAIEQQGAKIQNIQRRIALARQQTLERQQRLKAIETVEQRRENEVQKQELRIERRAADELAMQTVIRRQQET